jgi:hypothetical protein
VLCLQTARTSKTQHFLSSARSPIHRRRTKRNYITLIVCRLIVVIDSMMPRVNYRPQNHVRNACAKASAPEGALAGEAR